MGRRAVREWWWWPRLWEVVSHKWGIWSTCLSRITSLYQRLNHPWIIKGASCSCDVSEQSAWKWHKWIILASFRRWIHGLFWGHTKLMMLERTGVKHSEVPVGNISGRVTSIEVTYWTRDSLPSLHRDCITADRTLSSPIIQISPREYESKKSKREDSNTHKNNCSYRKGRWRLFKMKLSLIFQVFQERRCVL